jgi:hypothetical protein
MVYDAGGGGGSTSRWTNWNDKDVPTIWGYIGHLNLDPMWTHSSGWTKTHELASTNLYRLKDFRSKLAAAWPPEKSEAARVYVGKLDELIANVEAVYDSAVINQASASDMALSLGLAKGKLKPLYEEYQANAGRQAAYDESLAAKRQELLDTFGKQQSRGYVDSLRVWQQRNPNPAVAARQQEITTEVRGTMWGVSTDLSSANSRMVIPPPYTPPRGLQIDGGKDGGNPEYGGNGSGLVPPFIPAPLPQFASGNISTSGGSGSPALSGSTPPTATPPGGGTPLPIGGLPNVPSLPTGPISAPVLPPPPGGVIGGVTRPPVGGITALPGSIIASRPNPVGGVIGGTGRTGLTSGSRLINPIGGIVGGTMVGQPRIGTTGASIRAGVQSSAPLGANVRRSQQGTISDRHEWDPDNPWEVAEGVVPVIDAPSEWGPIDPGPSIGRQR